MSELKVTVGKTSDGRAEVGLDIASLVELLKNLMPLIQVLLPLFMELFKPKADDQQGPEINA